MTGHVIFPCLWMGYPNPDQGIKLTNFEYNQLAENAIATRFVEMMNGAGFECALTEHTAGYDHRYDFRVNNVKIELKISGQYNRGKQTLSVETKNKTPNGIVASGISTTEADAFLFINPGSWSDDIVVKWRFLPTTLLKKHIDLDTETALSGEDKNGYQSLGFKLKVDKNSAISNETPFGDGMFAFGPCVVENDKPWAFAPNDSNLFRKSRHLINAIGDMLK